MATRCHSCFFGKDDWHRQNKGDNVKHLLSRLFGGFSARSAQPPVPPVPPTILTREGTPLAPGLFGYKTGWFAVRADDPEAVLHALGACLPKQVPFADGAGQVYGHRDPWSPGAPLPALVCPPQDGWVLVLLGLSVALDSPDGIAAITGSLSKLSGQFGAAQYFGSYRVVNYVAWARAEAGTLTRGFSMADGEVFLWHGAPDPAELAQRLPMQDCPDGETFLDRVYAHDPDATGYEAHPNEETPLRIAAAWSIDPASIPPASVPVAWQTHITLPQ